MIENRHSSLRGLTSVRLVFSHVEEMNERVTKLGCCKKDFVMLEFDSIENIRVTANGLYYRLAAGIGMCYL